MKSDLEEVIATKNPVMKLWVAIILATLYFSIMAVRANDTLNRTTQKQEEIYDIVSEVVTVQRESAIQHALYQEYDMRDIEDVKMDIQEVEMDIDIIMARLNEQR